MGLGLSFKIFIPAHQTDHTYDIYAQHIATRTRTSHTTSRPNYAHLRHTRPPRLFTHVRRGLYVALSWVETLGAA